MPTLAVAVLLVFGLTVVLAMTGAFAPSRQALGSSTTITIIAGVVDVRHGAAPYGAATDGEILRAGDGVRTGPDGRAVLTYFEGSTVEIEPSSEVVIEALSLEPDGSTIIVMTQVIGHTWHVVARQLSLTSKYEVTTPAATAVVRGTTFEVLVAEDVDGEPVATVLTTEGTVGLRRAATTTAPAEEVRVEAGREAAAKRGRAIEQPRPRREPERVVTMTIGSERSVVVDPLGRANGLRDGKLVLQTPGAKVERVDGKLVVTLPDVPEGKLAAHVERDREGDETTLETRVRERGRDEQRSEARTALPSRGAAVVDVEVKRGQRPELRARLEGLRPSPSSGVTARRPSPSPTAPPRLALPTLPALPTRSPAPTLAPAAPTASPQRSPTATAGAVASPAPLATIAPALLLPTPTPLTSPTQRPTEASVTPSPTPRSTEASVTPSPTPDRVSAGAVEPTSAPTTPPPAPTPTAPSPSATPSPDPALASVAPKLISPTPTLATTEETAAGR